MALLRRVIGDALRARRQGQRRTLREVSTAANVSLGYLSEVERGQKEASSELLASICEALGSQLSEVLRDATDSLVRAEGNGGRADAGRVEAGRVGAGRVGAGRAGGELSAVALGGPVRPDGSLAERAVAEVPQPGTGKLAQVTRPRLAAGDPDSPTRTVTDGEVSVSVRRNGPFRTTLHTIRTRRADQPVTRAG